MSRFVLFSFVLSAVSAFFFPRTLEVDRSALHVGPADNYPPSRDGDNPDWVNWNWTNWQTGPPCPIRGLKLVPVSKDGPVNDAVQKISPLMDSYIRQFKWKFGLDLGIAIGVTYDGDVLHNQGYGCVKKGESQIPDGDTIWNLGSVTKIFTSLMLLKAMEQNFVHFDDPLSRFYNDVSPPPFHPRNPYGSDVSGVSLHSLATHTSGLPREPPCSIYNFCNLTEAQIFDYINSVNLFYPPFAQPHYSNLGIALMGRSLQRAVGMNYEDYLLKEVLLPMGMNSTGFRYSSDVIDRMAVGYTLDQDGKQIPSLTNTLELGWAAPCGGLYSSVNDLLQFLNLLFSGLDWSSKHQSMPLSPSRLWEYVLPGFGLPDGISGFGAFTFETAYSNGYWIITKGGLIDGFGTSLVLIPELHLGVAAVLNLDSGSPSQMTAQIVELLLPALLEELMENQPTPELPDDYEQWLGNYGVENEVIFTVQTQPNTVGVLNGTLLGHSVIMTWDKIQDGSDDTGPYTAFRYSFDETYSCLSLDSIGDDAVAYFQTYSGSQYVSIPDQHLWGLPKLVA